MRRREIDFFSSNFPLLNSLTLHDEQSGRSQTVAAPIKVKHIALIECQQGKEQQYQHEKIADKIIDFDFHIAKASSCAVLCVSWHFSFLIYFSSFFAHKYHIIIQKYT